MNRNKLTVIYDMLNALQEKGGSMKPTHLMYKANLSYESMKTHIEELKKQNLIVERNEGGKKMYALTDHGYKFIEEYKKFLQFSNAFRI